jgi:hypothetical protein
MGSIGDVPQTITDHLAKALIHDAWGTKSEIRSTKSETIPNDRNSNDQTLQESWKARKLGSKRQRQNQRSKDEEGLLSSLSFLGFLGSKKGKGDSGGRWFFRYLSLCSGTRWFRRSKAKG